MRIAKGVGRVVVVDNINTYFVYRVQYIARLLLVIYQFLRFHNNLWKTDEIVTTANHDENIYG